RVIFRLAASRATITAEALVVRVATALPGAVATAVLVAGACWAVAASGRAPTAAPAATRASRGRWRFMRGSPRVAGEIPLPVPADRMEAFPSEGPGDVGQDPGVAEPREAVEVVAVDVDPGEPAVVGEARAEVLHEHPGHAGAGVVPVALVAVDVEAKGLAAH